METPLESDGEEQSRGAEPSPSTVRGSVPQRLHWASCPESYRTNSAAEVRLLAVVDSFQRQYSLLYPDRSALLLCPANECGVKKFVCTSVRPSPSAFPELFAWQGCAAFVADFLSVELLEPPAEVPRRLSSPTSVLRTQRATCFESATLLCSLLLGAHYDAYCVSGYAVRQMCLLDQSPQSCPLLDTESGVLELQQDSESTVKPLKELKSHFLLQQEKKKQDAEAELLRQKLQEEAGQLPGDPLRGLRVHCWVLVLSGSRSVQENFFIDPLTGNSYSTSDDKFLGIESVWNNLNYYVNMQDCSNGCTGLGFDLDDVRMWEPLLFGATGKKQLILDVVTKKEKKLTRKISRDEEEEGEEPCASEMPRSWVDYIAISKKDLETRWPDGHKVTQYRKAKLERFGPYLRADGLVTRLTTYKDLDCTEVATVKEWYQHRSDHLEQRELDAADGFTTDRFKRGRSFGLLVHRHKTSEFLHELEFSRTHVDNLVRRVVSSREMTETFEGRSDFLFYRHVLFDQHVQFSKNPNDQTVQKVVERFHRNRSKPANEDVAERVFLLTERRVEVTYHLEDYRFIPSKRIFIKPQPSTEDKKEEDFAPAMVSGFQVDPSEKPQKTLALYRVLQALVKAENEALLHISSSIKEVRDIMVCREQEQSLVTLPFSCWTTTNAAGARKRREEMKHLDVEEQRWLEEKKEDILAPHLIRLGYAGSLSAEVAGKVYRACLAEYQERLVEKANLIQERYEKETLEVQRKQEWYQKNQLSMNDEQRKEYQSYCAEKVLQIRVAKERLRLHKDEAHQTFKDFNQRLQQDPRLAPHLSLLDKTHQPRLFCV